MTADCYPPKNRLKIPLLYLMTGFGNSCRIAVPPALARGLRGSVPVFGLLLMLVVLLVPFTRDAQAQIVPEEIGVEQAIERFYTHNFDILINRYEIDKAYGDWVGSKLLPNPQLSASKIGLDANNSLRNGDNTQDTIRLDQLIEIGGKRALRISAAAESLEAARFAHRDTIRTLLVGFYTVYYGFYQDTLSYDLAQEEVNRFRKILDIAEKRYTAGFMTFIDYTKLKLSVIDLENALTTAGNQVRNNSENLAFLVGSDTPLRPKRASLRLEFEPVPEGDLLRTAYENRYDLQAAQRQLKAAEHNVALAKAMRIPDVTVGVEWERFYPNYNPGVGAGLSFELPLFNRRQGEIARRTAEHRQLELQRDKTRRQIATEVRQAANNHETALKIFESYRTRKAEMDDLMQRTEKSFALGGVTVLELLDTQKTYRDFQTRYNQALAQSNLSRELINVYTGTIK